MSSSEILFIVLELYVASVVNLAGRQAGLANRIANFTSMMVSTDDEAERDMARAQVGRTINIRGISSAGR